MHHHALIGWQQQEGSRCRGAQWNGSQCLANLAKLRGRRDEEREKRETGAAVCEVLAVGFEMR